MSCGFVGIASAHGSGGHDSDGQRLCRSGDYSDSGNNDHSDDGCDYRRYEDHGKNGSVPDSYDFGHAHSRDDTPVQGLFDAF
jgi:hypothetical protein